MKKISIVAYFFTKKLVWCLIFLKNELVYQMMLIDRCLYIILSVLGDTDRSYCDQKLRLLWSECDCWVEFFVNCAKPSDGSIMIQFFHLRLWFRFVISYLIHHQVQKCLNLFTWQHDKFPFNALMNKIDIVCYLVSKLSWIG